MAQSPEEFEKARDFVDQIFVDINRPQDDELVAITIEINGDSSGGVDYSFARDLSLDHKRSLIRHAAQMLLDAVDGPTWQQGGFFAEFEERARARHRHDDHPPERRGGPGGGRP